MGLFSKMKGVFGRVGGWIKDKAKKVKNWIDNNKEKIKKAAQVVYDFLPKKYKDKADEYVDKGKKYYDDAKGYYDKYHGKEIFGI